MLLPVKCNVTILKLYFSKVSDFSVVYFMSAVTRFISDSLRYFEKHISLDFAPTNNFLVTYGALQVLYCIVLYCIDLPEILSALGNWSIAVGIVYLVNTNVFVLAVLAVFGEDVSSTTDDVTKYRGIPVSRYFCHRNFLVPRIPSLVRCRYNLPVRLDRARCSRIKAIRTVVWVGLWLLTVDTLAAASALVK